MNKKLNKLWSTILIGILLVSVFSVDAFDDTNRNPNVKSIKIEHTTQPQVLHIMFSSKLV